MPGASEVLLGEGSSEKLRDLLILKPLNPIFFTPYFVYLIVRFELRIHYQKKKIQSGVKLLGSNPNSNSVGCGASSRTSYCNPIAFDNLDSITRKTQTTSSLS